MAWRVGGLEMATLAIATVYLAIEPRAAERARIRPGVVGHGTDTAARTVFKAAAVAAVFIAAALKLSADSYSPFLYFQF
jgi:alginate O-acetyltransferase complex protein AlgI